MKAPASMPEFRKAAQGLALRAVPGAKVEFVWTFKGKAHGDKRRTAMNAYMVVTPKGAVPRLLLARYMAGYPLEVSSVSNMSWRLLSMQDQSVIKGAWGQVPPPSRYGVAA